MTKEKTLRKSHRRLAPGLKISKELYPRPVVDTFAYLRHKYPENTWDQRTLRKQVCLQYVKWMVYPTKENKHLLIEKVKEWRKGEEGRVGGRRSILEKLSRKFFKECKIEKNNEEAKESQGPSARRQLEQGTGRHTPELRALYGTTEYGKWMRSQWKNKMGPARHWWVFSPDGQVFEVYNLAEFGRQRGLDGSRIGRTARNPGWTYKGWRARERNTATEGFTPGFEP